MNVIKQLMALAIVVCVCACTITAAQEPPAPVKEHAWLQQMVGEWEYDSEMTMVPGTPPMKTKGIETVRAVGEFWVMLESKGEAFGKPFTSVMTLGYDTTKKKYLGSWIDSMNSHLIVLDGSMDEGGKALTMSCEMPNPLTGGKMTKFKDVIELKGKDHKTMTSSMQGEDGKWLTFGTVKYTRKK